MIVPTIDDIRRAAERIAPYAHRTPVLTCDALDRARRAAFPQVREPAKGGGVQVSWRL